MIMISAPLAVHTDYFLSFQLGQPLHGAIASESQKQPTCPLLVSLTFFFIHWNLWPYWICGDPTALFQLYQRLMQGHSCWPVVGQTGHELLHRTTRIIIKKFKDTSFEPQDAILWPRIFSILIITNKFLIIVRDAKCGDL